MSDRKTITIPIRCSTLKYVDGLLGGAEQFTETVLSTIIKCARLTLIPLFFVMGFPLGWAAQYTYATSPTIAYNRDEVIRLSFFYYAGLLVSLMQILIVAIYIFENYQFTCIKDVKE